jgi:photosystem II stability/assembly factor-like uncharacterized protein
MEVRGNLKKTNMKKVILLVIVIFIVAFNLKINAQWSEQSSGVTSVLHSVSAIDNNTAWICGAGGKVLRTTNGGVNWIMTNSPNAALSLYCIYGISSLTALVTGSSSSTYVYKTSNGGQNWTQTFSQSGGFINVIMHDQSSPYVIVGNPVGGSWTLFQSGDEGSTWQSSGLSILPQAGNESGFINAGLIFEDSYVSFGTNNSRIYHSFQAQNWIAQPTTGHQNIHAIAFVDTLIGVAGSSTGLLFTSNRGTNWLPMTSPGSGNINGIAFGYSYGELFYARGTSVYFTSNSGTNWVTMTTQTGTYNHMIRARSGYNIWAIRDNGGISKYNYPIGIEPIGTEIPSAFSLSQNYPNPFNPSTFIKFDVSKSSFVSLKIFDALGREIAALVNEQLKPGTYQVDWDGTNYTSGVYFYKLYTESYTATKKMILVK